MRERHSEYLRRVTEFVAREVRVDAVTLRPETRIEEDLGCTGEDAAELMSAFANEFDVDLTGVRLADYFGSEAGATPLSFLAGIVNSFSGSSEVRERGTITIARLAAIAANKRWIADPTDPSRQ